MPPIVLEHASANGGVGGLLVGPPDGRVDREAAGVGILAERLENDLPGHFRHKFGMRRHDVAQALADVERGALGVAELGVVEKPQVVHPAQDVHLADLRPFRVVDRVVRRRRLRESGQHRRLGGRHVLQRLPEIDLRCRAEPVGALPEEDLVDVELEDLVLAEVRLDLPGEQDFPKLAGQRLFAGQEEIPRDLHRYRPGPLLGPGRHVGERRPEDAEIVDPPVAEEPLVLGGQNGLFHDIRDVADGDQGAPLLAEFPQEVAFGRNDPKRYLGLVVGQAFERREGRIKERQHEGTQQAANDRQPKQDGPDVKEPAL